MLEEAKVEKGGSFDEAGFTDYLAEKRLVRPGSERYFAAWSRLFCQMRSSWRYGPWHEQLPHFLKYLRESGRAREWQMQQAEQSVRLYFTHFSKDKGL